MKQTQKNRSKICSFENIDSVDEDGVSQAEKEEKIFKDFYVNGLILLGFPERSLVQRSTLEVFSAYNNWYPIYQFIESSGLAYSSKKTQKKVRWNGLDWVIRYNPVKDVTVTGCPCGLCCGGDISSVKLA